MLQDSAQRLQAIDPRRSFIVQAPAGSGKTEILTQRYLKLLSGVSAPEQIIALTFTRKAASEMRQRILAALQQQAQAAIPHSAHQQQTYALAAEALAQSEAQNWQLLQQPHRLRIMTIDSLCQMISQAIPLQEKQVPYAKITDKPQIHYLLAARACFKHALEDSSLHQPLTYLLEHLDNRQDKLLTLFSELLAKRDQWLGIIFTGREQSKVHYEQMLQIIEQHGLARFKEAVPLQCREPLCALARQIAILENNPHSLRYRLQNWEHFENLDRELGAALGALLLTSQGSLRKSFDHHVGLKRGNCEDKIYTYLKTASKSLLSDLEQSVDFLELLINVKALPAPIYDKKQWRVLQALFTLLPLLAAHLQLVFSEQNEVDFTAVSQQALCALGGAEEPTDLTLYLDNSISHILVDEFQDTSLLQFQLLTKLVQGWQHDDGRTLFIVGDPMQSIYRFRQAEVGLFLKAQQQGLGDIPLTSLTLSCNFRSAANLVHWVNDHFNYIFPRTDDIESGAVSFHASEPALAPLSTSFIKAWQLTSKEQEAKAVVQLALEELANYPEDEVAILVRSRQQLNAILPLLREKKLAFQGIEIERLFKLPHLQDLWSLVQALLMPANRLAWMALLRSPLVGLELSDLVIIANFNKKKSIYEALSQLSSLHTLSEEGRIRAQYAYTVLDHALATRHQQPLVDWVNQSLKQLHADSMFDAEKKQDLEQFWLLLERCSKNSPFPDLDFFKTEFSKLYSLQTAISRLQIMTIHKSKGLEFDSVILTGLSSAARQKDKPLLRWLTLPQHCQEELVLISPVKAAAQAQCLVYDYLEQLDKEKDNYERQRLLYVATTRAKKRLYLFDHNEKGAAGSFRNLLKHQLFTGEKEEDFLKFEGNSVEMSSLEEAIPLERLPLDFYHHPPKFTNSANELLSFNPVTTSNRQIGVVAHELLQWICDHHIFSLEQLPWPMIFNRFKSLGFSELEQEHAYTLLHQQITNFLADPIGQWLAKPQDEEKNEYELLVEKQGEIHTKIIDRSFTAEGWRWVIDFKTGKDNDESQLAHRQQVNEYAELLSTANKEPLRCGLYYLATGQWLQWDYMSTSEHQPQLLETN